MTDRTEPIRGSRYSLMNSMMLDKVVFLLAINGHNRVASVNGCEVRGCDSFLRYATLLHGDGERAADDVFAPKQVDLLEVLGERLGRRKLWRDGAGGQRLTSGYQDPLEVGR